MNKEWSGERWETFVHNETALEHLHRYALACELSANKNVLDIACGEGYGSYLLAQNASSVTGVDIDAATIKKAQDKYRATHLRFLSGDARTTTLPDRSFDLIVSFETLEHLAEQDQLMSEFKRLLKPGGQLILSTPDRETYTEKSGYQNPFHKKELNRQEFETLLKRYFRHYRLLDQTSCHSSLILAPQQSRFDLYSGDHQQLEKNKVEKALYLIGIASDEELPGLNNSIFNGRSVLQTALEEQANQFRKTLSYRLGHFLLTPLKWIKKMFQ